MDPKEKRKRRRWARKLLWGLVLLVVAAIVAAIFLPELIPEPAMRRQVRLMLARKLGRPVTIDSAWFGWGEGLHVTGLRVGPADGGQPSGHGTPAALRTGEAGLRPGEAVPEELLATARQLVVEVDPIQAARSVAGYDAAIDNLRLEGLELWLVLGPDGKMNVDDLAAKPLKARSIQLTRATVHFDNRQTGRNLTFHDVNATLGELATTGRGYASLSAKLATNERGTRNAERGTQDERTDDSEGTASATGAVVAGVPRSAFRLPRSDVPGCVTVTANLSHMDLAHLDTAAGSMQAEWSDVPWPDVVGAVVAGSPLEAIMSRASGRMTATFGRGAWSAEGALDAADLRLAREGPWAQAAIPQAILGFQLQQDAPEKPMKINLVKFSAPGVDLKVVSQRVQFEKPAALAAAGAGIPLTPGPLPRREEGSKAAAPADLPAGQAGPWSIRDAQLRCTGNLTWVPLIQGIAPLKKLAENLELIGGNATVDLALAIRPDGPHLAGSVDLTDTQATWRGVFRKELRQTLRIEVDAAAPRDLAAVSVNKLDVVTEAGRAGLRGRLPLAGGTGTPAAQAAPAPKDGTAKKIAAAPVPAGKAPLPKLGAPPEPAATTEPPAPDIVGSQLAGAWLELHADIRQAEKLVAIVPAARDILGPLDPYGPVSLQLTMVPVQQSGAAAPAAGATTPAAGPAYLAPREYAGGPERPSATGGGAAAGGPLWTARLHGDLTGLRLAVPEGEGKRAGVRATIDAQALVDPATRRIDIGSFRARMDQTTVAWTGAARIEWPAKAEDPVGHFAGKLAISSPESAGAILLPRLFAADPKPLAGELTIDVLGNLSNRQLEGRLALNLDPLDIRAEDAFVKPAGQPASLVLAGQWQGGPAHHVEISADLQLQAASLKALGRGEVTVSWLGPAADDKAAGEPADAGAPGVAGAGPPGVAGAGPPGVAGAGPPGVAPAGAPYLAPREYTGGDRPGATVAAQAASAARGEPPAEPAASGLRIKFAPNSSVQVEAKVSDIARAAELCPALVQALKGYRTDGGAQGAALVSLKANAVRIGGNIAFTDAALDLGPYLKKPAGRPMTVDLAMDVTLPEQQAMDLHLANVEARLGDSVARAKGWVRLGEPSLVAALAGPARLAALVQEADLEVLADWQHNRDLRGSLPWLEPLYARSGLEGPTHLVLSVKGTPLRGQIGFDADATGCRIFNADTLLKPVGTPATVKLNLRYGEVPGEMILDKLGLKLADATATIDGRLLFDDPKLTSPAAPAAWSFHTQGQVPDASILASLFPARLADLKPAGALEFDLRASADAKATEVESCRLNFKKARLEWLGRQVILDGPVSYDRQRLASDGLSLVAGGSDLRIVAYVDHPIDDPTGAVIIRGTNLDLKEATDLLRRTSEYLAAKAGEVIGPPPAESLRTAGAKADAQRSDKALSDRIALQAQRLLAGARLSADVAIDHVTLVVPDWNTTYDLVNLAAEGRLAGRRFEVSRFNCGMDEGTITGELVLDFRPDVPVISYAYDARDLKMQPNLKPFIDTTFPGLQIFGMVNTHASFTQRLAEKASPVGRGETVLTDGLLVGPAAPDYITQVLPGLKLTQYRFDWMSNVFEHLDGGNIDNRMLFKGKAYDIYLFGITRPSGRFDYTLGVDLGLSLGSEELSRKLDQGKLPLMNYTGRIVASQMAEEQISYVLPHQFAYDVFVRRNILLQLIERLGEKPPEIKRPPVVPESKPRAAPQ